jgi:hypothetical protein
MKGRPHELNLSPDFDPLDPAQVSDPACWITGDAAEALKRAMVEKIAMVRHAPRMPRNELDLSGQVECDPATGRLRLCDPDPEGGTP